MALKSIFCFSSGEQRVTTYVLGRSLTLMSICNPSTQSGLIKLVQFRKLYVIRLWTEPSSVISKKSPNVYKSCPKMISLKNEIFCQLYKNCLICRQFGQNYCRHRLWKVVQSAINCQIWSHWNQTTAKDDTRCKTVLLHCYCGNRQFCPITDFSYGAESLKEVQNVRTPIDPHFYYPVIPHLCIAWVVIYWPYSGLFFHLFLPLQIAINQNPIFDVCKIWTRIVRVRMLIQRILMGEVSLSRTDLLF